MMKCLMMYLMKTKAEGESDITKCYGTTVVGAAKSSCEILSNGVSKYFIHHTMSVNILLHCRNHVDAVCIRLFLFGDSFFQAVHLYSKCIEQIYFCYLVYCYLACPCLDV